MKYNDVEKWEDIRDVLYDESLSHDERRQFLNCNVLPRRCDICEAHDCCNRDTTKCVLEINVDGKQVCGNSSYPTYPTHYDIICWYRDELHDYINIEEARLSADAIYKTICRIYKVKP